MYQYDDYDQTLVDERVAEFRDQTQRFLNGDLPEDEYRPLRLMNGVYIQRQAPMLRIAVPYGLISSQQMRALAHIARTYDKGYGHFTTRQNIQFNWPALENVPDILEALAKVQMHAIQTSGNCIRNVTSDPLSGIAQDELVDPRPYCEIIRQWSTFHPEFAFLPRKFKIAVSGAESDRAATAIHDIGLRIVKNDAGEIGFQVRVGGGLGRTPIIGRVINEFLPEEDLLSYLEAILRVYNLNGRRDNKYRARIKILVKETGTEAFTRMVDEEWARIKDTTLKLQQKELSRVKSFFAPPAYAASENNTPAPEQQSSDPKFATWLKYNTVEHKVPGYRGVYISLKPHGTPPGDITDTQMDRIAELADQYSFGVIRSTHEQNLFFADVASKDLLTLWQALDAIGLANPNIGTLTDMICCPGLEFCNLANSSSITVAKQIGERFDELDYLYDIGALKLKISGCMNACGHHDVGHIGLLGVDKKGEEWYQVTLGGSASDDATLGARLGPSIHKDQIVDALEKIVKTYLEHRENEDESFLETFRRIGLKAFKEQVYASH